MLNCTFAMRPSGCAMQHIRYEFALLAVVNAPFSISTHVRRSKHIVSMLFCRSCISSRPHFALHNPTMSQRLLLHDDEGTARTRKHRLQERTTCDEVLVKVWHLPRSLPWTDGAGKTFVDRSDYWWVSPQVKDRLRWSLVGIRYS